MIRLVLFDIDGTLLRGRDQANLAGWLGGLEQGLGLPGAHLDDVPHAGFTDRATALALARHHGLAAADAQDRLATFFQIKDRIMAEHVAADPTVARLEATTGAGELLAALLARGVTLGLVTGNTPAAAASKLRRAGLDPDLFSVGGYGDVCATREELVTAAVTQAMAHMPGLYRDQVAVVGDTALDVASAHALGSRAVAVLGGRGERVALEGAHADAVLTDLSPVAALAAILGTA